MSASNGGRGTPPLPPEGHGPSQEIPITKQVIQHSQLTTAERVGDGMHVDSEPKTAAEAFWASSTRTAS